MREPEVVSWRSTAVYVLAIASIALAGANVISYHHKLADKLEEAKRFGSSIQSITTSENSKLSDSQIDLVERARLYKLLNALGRDKNLHDGEKIGVVILDPDFYRGAYISKPHDTLLAPCAMQPFVVPALTGMPLLSPFAPRTEKCRYESYGYQYLAARLPMAEEGIENPCQLALARGFEHVVVVSKENHEFSAMRMDCVK